ncbi:MAG: TonB-dependent receptor [Acidobacteria bacterium]|nr:TonB-dependent receptor [Acidobacteriota bacterium]
MSIAVRMLACACALLIATGVAMAQTGVGTGVITGVVLDETKGVMPGVTVTVSGPAVMGTPSTTTGANGSYRVTNLPPGEYLVTFELAGFGTVIREGIRVGSGFTATVNVELRPATIAETVTVSGQSPIVDVTSSQVVTRYDTEILASLPGARDYWAVLAQTPAVSMGRVDVGGSGALTQQPYTAYGLSSAGGVNRAEVEGIMVNEGGGGGGSDMYYTDYGAFAEIGVSAVGNGADMPSPGVLSQLIAKSGGNEYHGNVYFDFQNDKMEATNISDAQIAAGVRGSDVLDPRDTNRLSKFQDFNADLGGFLVKDKLWWYGAYRRSETGQRYPTLLDGIQDTWVPVATAKATYNLTQAHRLTGFYQFQTKEQPSYLGAIRIGGGRQSPALMTQETVWYSTFPLHVWKAEYNGVLSDSLFFEVRTGAYHSVWGRDGKSDGPRIEDIGNNFVSGGVWGTDLRRHRPQANGSLTYVKSGWAGDHNFKFGGEVMRDLLVQPFRGFTYPTQALSVLNNGVPTQVDIYQPGSESMNGLWTYSVYLNDTWRVNRRLTINAGLRFDRHSAYHPEQQGPAGQRFDRVDDIVSFNNWGPRLAVSYDVTGDAKTVAKASFGTFWLYPAADLASGLNANATMWWQRYAWSDPNGNGYYDLGEEGRLLAVNGGRASQVFDPDLENTYVRQFTTYVEREIGNNFGVRTGFVWNGRRQVRGQINVNRPLDAYTVPVTFRDPGPDGRFNTADDGASLTGYNLSAEALALPVVNITTVLPGADSNYYTWEITATKRETSMWSMQASFAQTWSRETALGAGAGFTPNAFINADDEKLKSTTWQGKLLATLRLAKGFRLTPTLRHQSGTPFGRVFSQSFNWGVATIRAEPINAQRSPNLTVLDIRSEKGFDTRLGRLTGFFDVYNIFNTNAEQQITTTSGSSYLRPIAITPPRIARVGVKFVW